MKYIITYGKKVRKFAPKHYKTKKSAKKGLKKYKGRNLNPRITKVEWM